MKIMKGGIVEYDGESSEMTVENDEVKPQTIVENIIDIDICFLLTFVFC